MKNPIKKYFLLLSEGPFIISVMIFVIALIASAVYLGINEAAANIFIHKYAWIFLGGIFVNMCLAYFIREKYITTVGDYDYNTFFSVLVTKEGKRIILVESVWEKGKQYAITANRNYLSMTASNMDGETQTGCSINGKYKNSLVSAPVILKLKYYGVIDRMELFSLLIKNIPDSEELSLNIYLEMVFKKVNEPNQAKFDEIISRYAQLTISDADFLSELLDVVEFPERIFPCVTDTKICLGNPETSACKGMMCEK